MTFFAKVGSLAQPGSTGNQVITGLGFTPKLVLFWLNGATADGSIANACMSLGAATSSSNRRWSGGLSNNGVTTTAAAGGYSDAKCIGMPKATTGSAGVSNATVEADFVSMDADGFTINWTTVDATARIINYLALGGTDIANVTLGTGQAGTATGNKAYTGVGFKPDAILLWNYISIGNAPPNNAAAIQSHGPGWGLSATARAFSAIQSNNGVTTSNTHKYERTNEIVGAVTSSSGAVNREADLVTLDSDGFTLNWTTVTGTAAYFFYIAIKGPKLAVGSLAQPGSTGNQGITGVGFTPSALVLMSANAAASSSIGAGSRASVGAASGSSARFGQWSGDSNGVTTTVARSNLDRTVVLTMLTESATPSVNAAADLNSFDSDGFTLNWTSADATAREVLYLAFGAAISTVTRTATPVTAALLGTLTRTATPVTTPLQATLTNTATPVTASLSAGTRTASPVTVSLLAPTPTRTITPVTASILAVRTATPVTVALLATSTRTATPVTVSLSRFTSILVPLVVGTNTHWPVDGTGKAVLLAGSQTWDTVQDTDMSATPAALNFDNYVNFLKQHGHNCTVLWHKDLPRYFNWGAAGGGTTWNMAGPWPWVRSGPGNATDGLLKFDLTTLDQTFFDRVRARALQLLQNDIYAVVQFFDGLGLHDNRGSTDGYPFTSANNINGINDGYSGSGLIGTGSMTMSSANAITAVQDAYVQKLIDTLHDLPNVLWEVSEEADTGVQTFWQQHMIDLVHSYETSQAYAKHLVLDAARQGPVNGNIYTGHAEMVAPADRVAATNNQGKVVVNDSDHSYFGMWNDTPQVNRQFIWENVCNGASALFMDPYVIYWPTGSRNLPPGVSNGVGTGPDTRWDNFRDNLGVAARYGQRMNLAAMTPQAGLSTTTFCLANTTGPTRQWLAYAPNGGAFTVDLSAAAGRTVGVEWLNPTTGVYTVATSVAGGSGAQSFTPPWGSANDAVLFLSELVRTATPVTAALSSTRTRTAPATVALQSTLQRVATPVTTALLASPTRTASPVDTALIATLTRTASPTAAALQSTLTRTSTPVTAALSGGSLPRTATPVTAALIATLTRTTTPVSVALQATLTRTASPASASLSNVLTRVATPVTTALLSTLTRSVAPVTASVSGVLTRTATPVTVSLVSLLLATPGKHTLSDTALFVHTVSDAALFSHTVSDAVPAN